MTTSDSTKHSKPELLKHSDQAATVYNRILERIEGSISSIEARTWDTLKKEIDEAIEFEYDVAELTREEIELLGAYIKRDLKDLYHYMTETGEGVKEWLKLDISLVEKKVRDTLLSIADKSVVEQKELEQKIEHNPGDYMSGELACAGMLRCLGCSYMMCLIDNTHIENCHQCGGHYFKRVTSRWPRDPEMEP